MTYAQHIGWFTELAKFLDLIASPLTKTTTGQFRPIYLPQHDIKTENK
ncbi:Uncharacterised protein [Zhongshania aliphaticivorans]|nr:Uncharacterised protein [Zhongshania aliphaticivorans]